MKSNYEKITLGMLGLILLTALFAFVAPVRAQQTEPHLMITWQTGTYTPSWFKGKAFPTANSPISASVELVDSKGLVSLSGQKIYWYTNDQLIGSGVGLQNVTFNATPVADNVIDLRVEVPSYGSAQSNPVLKTIEIPVVNPEAVVESPFPNGEFSSVPIELRGWPFFFNAKKPSQLNFSWSANGESSQNLENPEVLDVSINSDAPTGSSINVGLTISVPGSTSDIATAGTNITFIK